MRTSWCSGTGLAPDQLSTESRFLDAVTVAIRRGLGRQFQNEGSQVVAERLDGTVALVTGASSGIGEATARALASQGAAVVVAARRKDRLDTLVKEINDAGGTALAIECDVTIQEQALELVAATVRELGRLDTLINNAGVMLLGPIVDAPIEEWNRMVALNVSGLLSCAHAAIPHLLTRGRGFAARGRRPRQHQLGGWTGRAIWFRRLQPDEAWRRCVQ